MNDYTKSLVRKEILEHRVNLRKAREALKWKQTALNDAQEEVATWEARIADLQTAIGDPIEIDPTYPQENSIRSGLTAGPEST